MATKTDPEREKLERLKLEAEIKKLEAETTSTAIMTEVQAWEWTRQDKRRRTIRVDDPLTNGTVTYYQHELHRQLTDDPSLPIEVVINCPGGSVLDGLELYDIILEKRARGATINTTIMGMAASMAGIIAQAGERRRMGANAYLMIHEVASMNMGKLSSMKDAAIFSERLYDRLIGIMASRANLSFQEIKDRAERRDWWLDSTEALEYGFVDEVLPTVAYATTVVPTEGVS